MYVVLVLNETLSGQYRDRASVVEPAVHAARVRLAAGHILRFTVAISPRSSSLVPTLSASSCSKTDGKDGYEATGPD